MIRLVQLKKGDVRRVAIVQEPALRLLDDFLSVYALANAAISSGGKMTALIQHHVSSEVINYDSVYNRRSDWSLLPPIDHPDEPSRCLVSGTGLTHLGGAMDRDAMHKLKPEEITDSMKMFRSGLEGGRPAKGCVGAAPEWFYKGNGTILRVHGESLVVPAYGKDGGEEGEIAGIYLIDPNGQPVRVGMTAGNEFSDHRFETGNYLNLAGSKIRTCAIGPEIVIDPEFQSVPGSVSLERSGEVYWKKTIRSGEAEMCHSLQNIEHHHFKFETHRRPGDVHVHYFGASRLSFGDNIQIAGGDIMEIQFDGFGRPLRNPLQAAGGTVTLVKVQPLV